MHPWLFWYHILMFYAYLVNHMTFVSCPPISVSQPASQVGLLIPHISRFVLNPKQADLHPPSLHISAQKQTPRPPAAWRDGPRNSHGSAHPAPRRAGSAKWMRRSSLRAASVILNHLPGRREGRIRSRSLEEGWARLWERIPLPAGWSGLNESHHQDGSVCQELTWANNVACGGPG